MVELLSHKNYFFVGIAGTGMSAIAQYLNGIGKNVSGSDREFGKEKSNENQRQFESLGLKCFSQNGTGITDQTDVVVISTAIESSNIEYQKAEKLGIKIIKRSEMLAAISGSCRTIAVGGTSGKSTTTAMIFHTMQELGIDASLITGAGLESLQQKGLPGNAWVGKSDWLIIEADESDGSIVGYKPEISIVLNIDRDHKEFDELIALFSTFKSNTKKYFLTNQDYELTKKLSSDSKLDFGTTEEAGLCGKDFKQNGYHIEFSVSNTAFSIPAMGKHNMENALATVSACKCAGISIEDTAKALKTFKGIYRRTQLIGEHKGIALIDDFAHNPAEVTAAIKACQNISKRVFAWFQPHGYGPLRFMHEELSSELITCLRNEDTVILSDVYYAGGTVDRSINSDIVTKAVAPHKHAVYISKKSDLFTFLKGKLSEGDTVLLMGARDPYLKDFALDLWSQISEI